MTKQLLGLVRRASIKRLTLLLAAMLVGSIALPAPPASASAVHRLNVIGSLDIKDDDVAGDDWCRNQVVGFTLQLDHTRLPKSNLTDWDNTCDEVRIELIVGGELMPDDRICNIRVELILYEGSWNDILIDDRDGSRTWFGGTTRCLRPGGWLRWDEIRVDNTAENEPDHGWLRNFQITHFI